MSAKPGSGLQPNVQITPSLRLVRPLAAGGMAAVWVARHQGLQTDVAVKFILEDLASEPEVLARFRREAKAASEVKSPHVVQLFDHGVTSGGLPYIVMELLEGENLDERIERERFLSPGEVAGVVLQVSRALSRAHEKKIVHRDIKPENIFLCETGEEDAFVKVLDFGIAKVSAPELQATATGEMLGSPLWMSPEQVMGQRELDHRSDVWSLGVVAFYALTGKVPFSGLSLGALSLAICAGDLPVPSRVNPELPPEIDGWFAKACARDVTERFQSARAMADALVAIVGGPSFARVRSKEAPSLSSLPTRLVAVPPSVPPPPAPSVPPAFVPEAPAVAPKPVPTRLLFAGASALLVILVGLGAWALSRDPRPEPVTEVDTPASTAASTPTPPASTAAPPPEVEDLPNEPSPDAAPAPPVAKKPHSHTKPKSTTTTKPYKPSKGSSF